MVDPLTISACISGATKAYNLVAKAVNAGREIEDTASYIGKFFDHKEKINEIEAEIQYGPKLFRGQSVEAQALEIQMAKKKTNDMETSLRELCYYTVGKDFYDEMMVERRKIRQRRLEQAKARAARKKLFIDGGIVLSLFAALIGVIIFGVNLARG